MKLFRSRIRYKDGRIMGYAYCVSLGPITAKDKLKKKFRGRYYIDYPTEVPLLNLYEQKKVLICPTYYGAIY